MISFPGANISALGRSQEESDVFLFESSLQDGQQGSAVDVGKALRAHACGSGGRPPWNAWTLGAHRSHSRRSTRGVGRSEPCLVDLGKRGKAFVMCGCPEMAMGLFITIQLSEAPLRKQASLTPFPKKRVGSVSGTVLGTRETSGEKQMRVLARAYSWQPWGRHLRAGPLKGPAEAGEVRGGQRSPARRDHPCGDQRPWSMWKGGGR